MRHPRHCPAFWEAASEAQGSGAGANPTGSVQAILATGQKVAPPGLKPDGLRAPGATAAQIAQCQADAGVVLPDDLKSFLAASNGYNGEADLGYLILWDTEELASLIPGYDSGPCDSMGGGVPHRVERRADRLWR